MLLYHAPRLLAWLPGVLVRTDQPGWHLTYDDGPSEATPRLLDLLAEARQTATFFVLAERAAPHAALLRRMRQEGHTVGAHGTVHTDYWRQPRRAVPEMSAACAALEDAIGEGVRYVRPPYGHLTPSLWRWARRTDRRVALWDVMPGDFRHISMVDRVAITAQKWAQDGSVVVLHDGPELADRAPDVLRRLLAAPCLSSALPPR